MDIWGWVIEATRSLREEGQGRLADLMTELPEATVEGRHEQVDAMAPEALALARGLGLPWVEVFVRHWTLQSRVAHRMDAGALPEALRLLDFAHGEATRGCPQAVCTVQDLTIAYGQVDGPGYGLERLAVADETLGRIDPSWPCFECITEERADALNDLGRHEEALAFRAAQERAAREIDRTAFRGRFRGTARALLALGRPAEAIAFLDQHAPYIEHPDRRHEAALHRALALARLGVDRRAEGLAALRSVKDPLRTPLLYPYWAEAAEALVLAGALDNDVALGATLARMLAGLERHGVGRAVIDVAAIAGRLAVARRGETLALRALAAMGRALGRLAAPLDAPARIEALAAAIATLTGEGGGERAVPESPAALLDALDRGQAGGPEQALSAIEAARRRWPEDGRLVVATWNVLRLLGLDQDARDVIAGVCEAHPEDVGAALALGTTLISLRDWPALDALTDRLLRGPDPSDGHFLLAQRAMSERDFASAIRHGLEVIARVPAASNTRRLVYSAAIQVRDFPLALRMARELVERSPEPGPADWGRIVAGSAVGAWGEVRESARRLGMDLEGEGPIDEPGELCRLRFEEDNVTLFAQRIGPATARVIEIAGPRRSERYGDQVVIDPDALEAGAEGGADPPPLFAVLHTVAAGGYRSFVVDGVHPGDEALRVLRSALAARGAALQIVSGDRYQVTPAGADPLPGVYGFLALSADVPAAEASALLREATASWPGPLVWPGLAREAGDTALLEEHQATARRLGL
jgi:tetratricopeptide (TPR) repeat protein